MGLWFPWLEWCLFLLVTEACEVSILMTRLALTFLCWTLKTFNMILVPTLLTSLLVLVYILCTEALLVMALPVTCIILVTWWSRLNKGLPLLVFALMGGLCTDVSSNWSEPPVGHLPPAWCAWQSPLSSQSSLQGAWPFLYETSPDLCYCCWLSWRQTLHLWGKTKRCSYEVSWLLLEDT